MPFALITFQSIINSLKAIVDFSIIWVLVYYILRIVRNNSRTVQIFKGIVLIIAMRFVAHKLSLTTLKGSTRSIDSIWILSRSHYFCAGNPSYVGKTRKNIRFFSTPFFIR
ncbi:hypothetical protein MX850_06060 [Erysipelothrix sp. Poltava]|nr:hypothetical protein MX850_06060 [Erysipelothrix sp. Poltava]